MEHVQIVLALTVIAGIGLLIVMAINGVRDALVDIFIGGLWK